MEHNRFFIAFRYSKKIKCGGELVLPVETADVNTWRLYVSVDRNETIGANLLLD